MNMAVVDSLAGFERHSLADQSGTALMNRVDTKFMLPARVLEPCLPGLQDKYTVLDMDGDQRFGYDTLYLDTPNRQSFLDHHNGKLNRFKCRLRHYRQSQITFLEVKKKTNRLRTEKSRVQVTPRLNADVSLTRFLSEHSGLPAAGMQPALFVSYQRATLINREGTERVTLDTHLAFHSPDRGRCVRLPNLAVVEIKYDRKSNGSPMRHCLGELGYRPVSFSKYCVGSSLLFSSELKINRFKPLLRTLHGICG